MEQFSFRGIEKVLPSKEEFEKAKDVEDVEVQQDKDWADSDIENYIEWIKALDIKEVFGAKSKK